MENEELIPTQQIGRQTDAEEKRKFNSLKEAEIACQISAIRLLNVNDWHKISPAKGIRFQLTDSNGAKLDRLAKQKDYIQIDITTNCAKNEESRIWLCIEHFEEFSDVYRDIDGILFVTRPSKAPGIADSKIAHFLSSRATSTFIVFREANVLSVEFHGRNEAPNTEGLNLIDLAKNLVVSKGSNTELYFKQWQYLVSGILS